MQMIKTTVGFTQLVCYELAASHGQTARQNDGGMGPQRSHSAAEPQPNKPMYWLLAGMVPTRIEPFNEPAVAGGSIKPRVERSGTLGWGV